MKSYCYTRKINGSFDGTIEKITEELEKEGFGILTDIDVKAVLKKKLDVDFRRYRILGACNPVFSHKAILAEERVGTMLPCNIVVQEKEDGVIDVSAIDPVMSMMAIENDGLKDIASHIRDKLISVVDSL